MCVRCIPLQNECDHGDVLEALFESSSVSGRFRTTSASSVSFAVPSLSSCDIFPEIAGVVSASDSETDVGEYLVWTQDHLHASNVPFSSSRLKFRQNSAKQGESSMKEMLETLCFNTHDLTHVNDTVQNVVLDWHSGAALDNCYGANERVVKAESSGDSACIHSEDYVDGLPTIPLEGITFFECYILMTWLKWLGRRSLTVGFSPIYA